MEGRLDSGARHLWRQRRAFDPGDRNALAPLALRTLAQIAQAFDAAPSDDLEADRVGIGADLSGCGRPSAFGDCECSRAALGRD
jgi:hypothetical protein